MAKSQHSEVTPTSAGGLFRAVLGRPGISFKELFAHLEKSPLVERLTRHPKRGILWAQISLAPNDGAGYFEFTRIRDDIFVIVENFAFKDPRLERVGGDGLIQFNFRLAGDLTMGVSRVTSLRLVKPSLFIWNQPTGCEVNEWTAPAAQERAVAISVHPQFLLDQFQLSALDTPSPLRQFLANSVTEVSYLQLPLSAAMFELAAKLVSNKHSGAVRLVYIETVAMELLCEAVASVAALSQAPNEHYSDRQLRALHSAKAFLMRQFSPRLQLVKSHGSRA